MYRNRLKQVVLIAMTLSAASLAGCDEPMDARGFDARIDGVVFRGTLMSGRVGTMTDRETGCEYIIIGYTQPSATPRIDAAGKPMCRAQAVAKPQP